MSPREWNAMDETGGKEIDLKGIVSTLKKQFWLIAIIAVIITMLFSYYKSHSYMPMYQSSTQIMLDANTDTGTLLVMIKNPLVLEKVAQQLDFPRSAGALAGEIQVNIIGNSNIIELRVTDPDPTHAASIANITTAVFKAAAETTLGIKNMDILAEAAVNNSPVNTPHQVKNMIEGVIIGLVLGMGIAYFRDSMDDTIRSRRELETLLGVPVLGTVSRVNRKNSKRRSKQSVAEMEMRGETVGVE